MNLPLSRISGKSQWFQIEAPPCPYCELWIGSHTHMLRSDGEPGLVVLEEAEARRQGIWVDLFSGPPPEGIYLPETTLKPWWPRLAAWLKKKTGRRW